MLEPIWVVFKLMTALLKRLMNEDITVMREGMQGRRVFFILLTEKGRKIASLPDGIGKEFQI